MLPGGFGTMDEAFELLTLIQTGKSDLHPIILLQAEGTGFWEPIIDFMRQVQLPKHLISESDLSLFHLTTDPHEAATHILEFYANYHSTRYWGGRLIIRLLHEPDDALLDELNRDYADIVVDGRIEKTPPVQAEIDDDDALECHRIAFLFDRRHFGRLRQLVDRLNRAAPTPERVHPPEPMSEEHAERPW
jgi:hypothetical protein